jgi:hypothetical protein
VNYLVTSDYMFPCHPGCQACNKYFSRYDCTSCASGFEITTTFPIYSGYKSFLYNDHHELKGCFCPIGKMESDGVCQDYCDYGHRGTMVQFIEHGIYSKLEKHICIRACPYSYPGVKRYRYDTFLNQNLDPGDYRRSVSYRRSSIKSSALDCEVSGVDFISSIYIEPLAKTLKCTHGPVEVEELDTQEFSVGIWVQNNIENGASYGIYEISNMIRLNSDQYTTGGDGKNQFCIRGKYSADYTCLLSEYVSQTGTSNIYLPKRWVYVGVAVKKIEGSQANYNITMVELQYNPSAAGIIDPNEIPNPRLDNFHVTTAIRT